jgi:parvulin-like peptidyl-prolyl cis-trans isomerase-like protein
VAVPQGLAVLSLAEARPPQPAPFDAVKSRVEADLKKFRSRDKEKSIAAEILAASGDLKSRTSKLKLEVKSYPAVSRMQPLPPLTDASKSAAFVASAGAVLGPFDSDDGLVVMQVGARKPATSEEAASERAALKRRLIDEDRSTLYQAFLARLQKNAKIDVNETLLQQFRPKG